MSYVPVEKVTTVIKNKYEAVVVAAREARNINNVLRMVGRDDVKEKVTTRALRRVSNGDVDFVYLDEQPAYEEVVEAAPETAENEAEKPAS